MRSIRNLVVGLAVAVGLGTASAAPAGAASAPTCTPRTLNTSAVQAGSVTVSPQAGSRDASAETQISFLGVPVGDLHGIRVVGSRTGAHAGRLEAYTLGDGGSFVPSRPFADGELVSVRAEVHTGPTIRPLLDQFVIAQPDSISSTPETIHPGSSREVQYFRSRPDLRPPNVRVTVQSPLVAPGDLFLAPYTGPGQAGPMILDQSGGLVWFHPLPAHTSATNFRVQEFAGKPVLTWWQGDISVHGFGQGVDVIADQSYTTLTHVKAGNGLQADLHEFQLTPQGTALITAFDPILCNLSAVGGPARGAVTDGVFQEIDVRTGLVMFQWSSLDHVGLSESYERASSSTTSLPFDFFHINSIGLGPEASLLISARNTWTVYDVDARTGQLIWRLGGKQSSFTMAPGARTAWQHDPRWLPDGSLSIFDNGASPTVHSQSRAIVLRLDPQQRTATLLRQITHPPPLLAESQGNAQELEGGDWFIGWGQIPDFSEFNPAGQLLFDAHFPHGTQSYRAYRLAWTGVPRHSPAFVVQRGAHGAGTAYASWNGATLLAGWRVLSGSGTTGLAPIAQAARSGFETAIALPAGTVGPYVAVQALDAGGAVIGTSPTSKIA